MNYAWTNSRTVPWLKETDRELPERPVKMQYAFDDLPMEALLAQSAQHRELPKMQLSSVRSIGGEKSMKGSLEKSEPLDENTSIHMQVAEIYPETPGGRSTVSRPVLRSINGEIPRMALNRTMRFTNCHKIASTNRFQRSEVHSEQIDEMCHVLVHFCWQFFIHHRTELACQRIWENKRIHWCFSAHVLVFSQTLLDFSRSERTFWKILLPTSWTPCLRGDSQRWDLLVGRYRGLEVLVEPRHVRGLLAQSPSCRLY